MPPLNELFTHTHILIAEDEVSLAAVLKRLILRYDPDAIVWLYPNGRDALAGYDAHGADLIISNHHMPPMDGPVFIRTLRKRGDTVPIIGISGNPENAHEFLAAGATLFLESSRFTKDLLPSIIALLTERQWLAARGSL